MLFKHGLAGLAKVPAASGLTKTFLAASTDRATVGTGTSLDFTGTSTSDQIYLLLTKSSGTQSNGITGVTLEGSSATLVGATSSTVARTKCYIYKIACPAAAANNAAAAVNTTGSGSYTVGAWKISATPSTETVASNQYDSTTTPLVGSVNTVSGGVMLGVAMQEESGSVLATTGGTEDSEILDSGTNRHEWFSAVISSTETPRTIETAHSGTASNKHGAIITVALS